MKAAQKAIGWLLAAFMLIALGVALMFWTFNQIDQTAQEHQKTNWLLFKADNFLSALTAAETGQRGFLLTGDEAFLKPYAHVRTHLAPQLEELHQSTFNTAAQKHLEAITPLMNAKLAELAQTIELRRRNDISAATALVRSGQGQQLMDAIRIKVNSFIMLEESARVQHDAAFQANIRQLFGLIVAISVLALLAGLVFANLLYRAAQQKQKEVEHLETQRLLELQASTNQQLQRANATLRDSEEKLIVTLASIGDAVIATDAQACITILNPVAQQLTGWAEEQAKGRPVNEVFHIINKETRQLAIIPVAETLENGTVQGLANHTVLIARDGREFDIADSCAPICNPDGQVVGAVLVFRNVTQEYAVQQALRDSVAQNQTILNTVVDGIITVHAHGGKVQSVNPAAEHMFGYRADELNGQSLSQLIPELNQNQNNVSLDYYRASDEARANGLSREVLGQRKDGSTFPLEIAVSEMSQGGQKYFTGILRDITARKQAEAALVKAGALQSAIFNSANFSSIATDAKGVIQIFNVGAERMLGYSAAEVMNKITPADISDPQEVIARAQALSTELETPITPGFEALVFKASRGIEDIYELTYIRKDGSRVPAVVSVTALRDSEDDKVIIGYLLIGTDNTARKQVEAERGLLNQALRDKNIELERARQVADKANLAKSEFLSSMSHELRSPLNAILGFSQLLETGTPPLTPVQKANIDQILRAGWYLLELINEILDLALIESGTLSLSLEPVSLPELLRDCQAMIEPQSRKREISISFPLFDGAYFVHADRTRLKQVMINLLSNAIKYNKLGGTVKVTYSAATAQSLRICVQDSGAGLSPEKIVRLFQPFNRLGQESGNEEGTGIGLVVSKRLIELMEGSIGVQSTVGVGSVFWIEVNLASAQELDDETDAPYLRQAVLSEPGAVVRTLLYIEDNLANMELVEQLIARRPDMRLLGAGDGARGIALARKHQPDLILMDINLPGISGLQALKILRDDPNTAHIPVLALSANAMPRDIERGLEAGFFRYITKPIKVNEFMAALDMGLALLEQGT